LLTAGDFANGLGKRMDPFTENLQYLFRVGLPELARIFHREPSFYALDLET